MVASNTSTVLYLWRHVRRMEDSSSSSALHYQMQKRVTIMSIIQTLLFFFYSAGIITYEFQKFLHLYFGNQSSIYLSLLAFYCFGTSIILGVGQWLYIISAASIFYAMRTSFTASLGLNVFYYFQIVPAHQPFLIWVKTHIKLFVYLTLFFDRIFFLLEFIIHVIPKSVFNSEDGLKSSSVALNFTSGVQYDLILTDFGLRCVYFLVCLGIMVASNISTVLYLWRHVKRMEDSSSFSALQYQKQKRVAILSIIQTLLFFFSSAWLMADEVIYKLTVYYFDLSGHMVVSVVGFYCFGITIILGVGQTKFRVRAVEIGEKLVRLSHRVP
ncbi:uncharacterized protein [Misgurnus anguillicaudatus]|uniref:uncharacterized protein n=1 Tax=Misgurnus anguillicaudatus TaxID=75329 RepID=UPI003CCFAC7B